VVWELGCANTAYTACFPRLKSGYVAPWGEYERGHIGGKPELAGRLAGGEGCGLLVTQPWMEVSAVPEEGVEASVRLSSPKYVAPDTVI
jgi:hypothetical protein